MHPHDMQRHRLQNLLIFHDFHKGSISIPIPPLVGDDPPKPKNAEHLAHTSLASDHSTFQRVRMIKYSTMNILHMNTFSYAYWMY